MSDGDVAQPAPETRPTTANKPNEPEKPAAAPASTTSTASVPAPLKIDGPALAIAISRDEPFSPALPGASTPNPWAARRQTSFDLDDYFTGPRDIGRHSKWPVFLQMHGSILPKMIMPLIFIGGWATAITVISENVRSLGVQSTLLTVTGFVVGLGLSFRSSTAYERYNEGRKYWASMMQASQALARVFWIHAKFPADRDPREVMLKKVSALQLILAFAVSVKHKLRFEPYTSYDDLQELVAHMHTLAGDATAADPSKTALPKKNFFKEIGEYLGISFAQSNPRKTIKKAQYPLGNLPLEIISYLSMTLDKFIADGQLPVPMMQTVAYNNIALLNDVMIGTERILNTPLPIAYTIAISQITWVYVLLLPFQLFPVLGWVTIPATIGASYIILAILMIGMEIENPFGSDVNDLPLEMYCEQIAMELDIIAAHDVREGYGFMESKKNMPLYPVSMASYNTWVQRPEERIREAIRTKPNVTFENKLASKKPLPAGDDMV